MDSTREWEILERTTTGRAQIIDAYERAIANTGLREAGWCPFDAMIETILDTECDQESADLAEGTHLHVARAGECRR